LKDKKGCLHADPKSINYKKDTTTFLNGYDPNFSVEGCPVDIAINNPQVWGFCMDVLNSKSYYLPDMPFLQVQVFNSFIIDRNVVEEINRLAGVKSG